MDYPDPPPARAHLSTLSSSVLSAEHGKTELLVILLRYLWKSGLLLSPGSDLALLRNPVSY